MVNLPEKLLIVEWGCSKAWCAGLEGGNGLWFLALRMEEQEIGKMGLKLEEQENR